MLCDNCGKREANVRYSENINGRKKELTIIFVSQLLFSFQGTSLSVLFRALKIEQYLLNLYLSPVPMTDHLRCSVIA